MSLGQSLVQQLRDFLSQEKDSKGGVAPNNFETVIAKIALHLKISDFDRLSFMIEEIVLQNTTNHFSIEQLKQRADRLIGRVTYLLEDFQLVEMDGHSGRVQLRSRAPQKDDRYLSFYEMLLSGDGRISLRRYKHDQESQLRSATPMHFTEELLVKLLNDFFDIVLN
jgi:hypothetical protein